MWMHLFRQESVHLLFKTDAPARITADSLAVPFHLLKYFRSFERINKLALLHREIEKVKNN